MAFSPVTGIYTSVAGAVTAVPGAVIQSAIWNNIHTDLATALSQCLTRFGNDNAETTIVSTTTTDLSQANTTSSLRIKVTGTTTITSLGTAANLWFIVRFTGILTLTYNATTLILPGAANITTAAGDEAVFTSDGSGNWRCVSYQLASGFPLLPVTAAMIANATITTTQISATAGILGSQLSASAAIGGGQLTANTVANSNLAQMAALTFKGNNTAATANAADLTASALRTAAGLDQIGFRNIIGMAGGFEIWQRGAGASASIAVAASSTSYTADRWYIITLANQASTISAQAGLTNGSQLCAQVQRNSGQTGTGTLTFGIPLTTAEVARLRGQYVAISCTLATGANWSPTSGTITAYFDVGTGTEQKSGGFTNLSAPVSVAANIAAGSSAARFTAVSAGTVPANSTQGELVFFWTPVGTAGANDWFQIDDVQIEAVPTALASATAFERWPFDECLLHCQRHYRKTFPYGTAPAQSAGIIGTLNVTAGAVAKTGIFWESKTPMRASGTYTTYNPSGASANWQDLTAAASNTATIDPSATQSPLGVFILCSTVAVASDTIAIHAQCDAGL